jgi:hypothetical protein
LDVVRLSFAIVLETMLALVSLDEDNEEERDICLTGVSDFAERCRATATAVEAAVAVVAVVAAVAAVLGRVVGGFTESVRLSAALTAEANFVLSSFAA